MKASFIFTLCAPIALLVFVGFSAAGTISYSDLWDVTQGTVVSNHSGVKSSTHPNEEISCMFGLNYCATECGNTLFKDYYWDPGFTHVPAGYVHYVEWNTPSSITLRSFDLHAANDGVMTARAFNRFTLYYSSAPGNPWTSFYDTGDGFSYLGMLDLESDLTPVNAQYFRAEFVQALWTSGAAIGPRIIELDGFETFLDGSLPEPSSIILLAVAFAGILPLALRRYKNGGVGALD
ncbi:MAG: hypothetical protein JW959_06985 [Pirellulales bacterium]|nr:hypothetical protein [Pirellulales bacterium]